MNGGGGTPLESFQAPQLWGGRCRGMATWARVFRAWYDVSPLSRVIAQEDEETEYLLDHVQVSFYANSEGLYRLYTRTADPIFAYNKIVGAQCIGL